ncbi:hypothetical protein EJB05_35171, partial [Eragrostis curvula]
MGRGLGARRPVRRAAALPDFFGVPIGSEADGFLFSILRREHEGLIGWFWEPSPDLQERRMLSLVIGSRWNHKKWDTEH